MKLTVQRVLKSSGTILWKKLLNKGSLKWYIANSLTKIIYVGVLCVYIDRYI